MTRKGKPAALVLCLPLLRKIKKTGSCGVYAENLIQAGAAVEAGYARVEDDREGPVLYLLPAGDRET